MVFLDIGLVSLLVSHYVTVTSSYYVMTSCETFVIVLASFEGFLVTFMYCFLNLEVQTELQRSFRYWWWRADGQERFRR